MDIVLIAGMWLDAAAWHDVVPELESLGHRPLALTLPGQGDGNTTATYADQVAAVVAAVDAADGPTLVVGHSAACALAWVAADGPSNSHGSSRTPPGPEPARQSRLMHVVT